MKKTIRRGSWQAKKYSRKRVFKKKDFMLPKTKIRLRVSGARLEHGRVK